ncbi:cysteine peptidase family C39 domain-containing protein [Tengunoibacter tsumagoiensis]|uniref:Peptidase C39 domain-containing protein n=1 Tax=Tengunoibacter tsumagoiensis TaxID=2014871 RepID=A0A402A9Z2_9CHLR|nr:cysteine peptidase family C39 domain-containing protein [Tengunoibacter tsumagoiensis]GCE15846.1 hypothetical protein KTT_57050 [Tengunoibacter tsumagoiensis]
MSHPLLQIFGGRPLLGGGLICILVILCIVIMQPLFTHASPLQTSLTRAQNTQAKTSQIQFVGVTGVSRTLVRVGQLDRQQYASDDEFTTWSPSACSAAAMTEVINAYGNHYKITDILKVEADLQQITPEAGLLQPSGIDRTVNAFGFDAAHLDNPPLDDVLKIANQGQPVIISFPPGTWSAGGHILILRGGHDDTIYLADSSKADMVEMTRTTFLHYWRGFAVVVTPQSNNG